jgi:hypothetical protein
MRLNRPCSVPVDEWARGLRDQFRRQYQQTWDRKVLIAQKMSSLRGFQRLRKADYDNYWRVLMKIPPLHPQCLPVLVRSDYLEVGCLEPG